MKVFLVVVVIVATLATHAYAQSTSLPRDVDEKLKSREIALQHQQVDWELKQTTVQQSADAAAISKIQKELPDHIRRDLRKSFGITDTKIAQKYVDARVASAVELESAYKVEKDSIWHWSNDGSKISVSGEVQDSPSLLTGFTYYFCDDWGMYVNTKSTDPKTGEKISLDKPSAWRNFDGVLSSPVANAPYLKPSDGVFLFARNPLNAYKSNWHTVSRTSSTLTLETEIIGKSSFPTKLSLNLDIAHGMAPSRLSIVHGRRQSVYQVEGFTKNKNIWLPKQVNYSLNTGNGTVSSSEWHYITAKPAGSIVITLVKGNEAVTDYRLLEDNLSPLALIDEQNKPNSKIVAYKWNGELPPYQQLQYLQKQQHPGESSPDPGKTSSSNFMLLLGGMLCLVGGIWMFKRRGVS